MPYFSSTLFVVVIVLSVLATLTGYFLFVRSLFAGFAARAEFAWSHRPWLSFLLGVPTLLVLGLGSFWLLNAPSGALRIAGFGVGGLSLGFVLGGTSGLAARVGRGLSAPTDAGREWARTLRGGIVLEISMLLPVLGWFLIAPLAVIGGAGAAARALFSRGERVVSPRPPAELPASARAAVDVRPTGSPVIAGASTAS